MADRSLLFKLVVSVQALFTQFRLLMKLTAVLHFAVECSRKPTMVLKNSCDRSPLTLVFVFSSEVEARQAATAVVEVVCLRYRTFMSLFCSGHAVVRRGD